MIPIGLVLTVAARDLPNALLLCACLTNEQLLRVARTFRNSSNPTYTLLARRAAREAYFRICEPTTIEATEAT
jgi:hypothetical protein